MPSKKACQKIKDPKKRADCLAYKGKFKKYATNGGGNGNQTAIDEVTKHHGH